jgi:membrane protease YdiL (CAAX protease family)
LATEGGKRLKKRIILFILPLLVLAIMIGILLFLEPVTPFLAYLGEALLVAGWAVSIVSLVLLRKEKKKGTISKLLKAAFTIDIIALIWSSLLVIQIIPAYFM